MAVLQNKTPCIETTHCRDHNGYGRIRRNSKNYLHHRYVYEQHYGSIPRGLIVRHLCHNPSCVNIEHLVIGTRGDNRDDNIDAGKFYGNQRLTENQAQEILDCKPSVITIESLQPYAKKYNVHQDTIRKIWSRVSWKHLS